MLSEDNKVVIASAGSGKTTYLVLEAVSRPESRIVILTYTNNNKAQIEKNFYERHGGIPKNVEIVTWYAFLLHECVRPYQRSVYSECRVKTINFPSGKSDRYAKYADTHRYYFRNGDEIYADKISRFVLDCQTNSGGLVTERLGAIYDAIFIDEFQDLAGYDLEVLKLFLESRIRTLIVGDPRQCTYITNNAAKNAQYRGMKVLGLIKTWTESGLCEQENHSRSYRCNQKICDFADCLWPDIENTTSHNNLDTGHDGIYIVSETNIHAYIEHFSPTILRYDKKANTYGYPAMNFGGAKGLEFERVLIVPHGPMKKFLRKNDLNEIEKSLEKFYVAVTRAKHSVAFVYEGKCGVDCVEWDSASLR